jgi:hypothetical protein
MQAIAMNQTKKKRMKTKTRKKIRQRRRKHLPNRLLKKQEVLLGVANQPLRKTKR